MERPSVDYNTSCRRPVLDVFGTSPSGRSPSAKELRIPAESVAEGGVSYDLQLLISRRKAQESKGTQSRLCKKQVQGRRSRRGLGCPQTFSTPLLQEMGQG